MALSPLLQRRFANFRRHRRGVWSLRLFLLLLLVSLFSELIANDKPLLIRYEGKFYSPLFQTYAETTFGGEFDTEADYHDAYLQDIITQKGNLYWPPVRFSYDTIDQDLAVPAPSAPDKEHWLGTDDRGRDVFARVLYGLRVSILFGLALTVFGSLIGIVAGAIQGYFGGWTDILLQRFIEIWSGLPMLFLLIILSSLVTPNIAWLFAMMLVFGWMDLVGVVRAEFYKVRKHDYVKAARALGVRDSVLMQRHILPNALVATITKLPFILSGAITTLTALDFLGFGLPPQYPSLGELVAQGKANLQAPWLGISSFMVLSVLLSLLVFVGEAVRDAFDSRKG
jgi:microcin C transport system permease protein